MFDKRLIVYDKLGGKIEDTNVYQKCKQKKERQIQWIKEKEELDKLQIITGYSSVTKPSCSHIKTFEASSKKR